MKKNAFPIYLASPDGPDMLHMGLKRAWAEVLGPEYVKACEMAERGHAELREKYWRLQALRRKGGAT